MFGGPSFIDLVAMMYLEKQIMVNPITGRDPTDVARECYAFAKAFDVESRKHQFGPPPEAAEAVRKASATYTKQMQGNWNPPDGDG